MPSTILRMFRIRVVLQTTVFLLLSFLLGAPAQLAYGAAPFYEGKTIRIIVGTSPGGGYDTYTRLIARHFGKYIPGNPTVIVDNMPGAGGLVSANYLFKVAKPDGLTIGHFVGGQFLQQLLAKPGIEFDALNLNISAYPLRIILSLASPRRPASRASSNGWPLRQRSNLAP
jgi:tripartite-type tricarboxylate transporter receptor subunit TctC